MLMKLRSMRMTLWRGIVIGFLVSCAVLFTFWHAPSRCDDTMGRDVIRGGHYNEKFDPGGVQVLGHHLQASDSQRSESQPEFHEIPCQINGEYTVDCGRRGDEVYLPFSFIHKYFEVYGHLVEKNGDERFEWQHAFSQVYPPKSRYRTQGVFMTFEHYNVEVRDRVRCISGRDGVPLSTQWSAQGHFYPIQIAQFGLSHYSKYLTSPPAKTRILEDGSRRFSKWLPASATRTTTGTEGSALGFETAESLSSPGLSTKVGATDKTVMTLDYKFLSNASISVTVNTRNKLEFTLHYVCTGTLISATSGHIYYGLGPVTKQWRHLTRNLNVDLNKGLMIMGYKTKQLKTSVKIERIQSIVLRGRGAIDNLVIQDKAHLQHFFDAADWVVANQDAQGGWPVQVQRRLAAGRLELDAGWYSAMAQGQAMSLLSRAYILTKKNVYLQTALAAVKLFKVVSQDGGVQATFMDKHPWYEEYPTTPSSFVLNGFIYSLLGLYDLKSVANADDRTEAEGLYENGMSSLKAMLPLYDSGSGSIYDLRHITLGVAPNLARWDYHTTHINQLLLLGTIEPDQIINSTAARWQRYMKGERAPHN